MEYGAGALVREFVSAAAVIGRLVPLASIASAVDPRSSDDPYLVYYPYPYVATDPYQIEY